MTIDDLTRGQVAALATIMRVNLNAGSKLDNWVDVKLERINTTSIRALARRGLVVHGEKLHVARVPAEHLPLAEACRVIVEEGPR